MLLTLSLVLLLVHFVTKKGGGKSVPNAWQSLVELIYDFVPNLVNEQIGGLSGNVKQQFFPCIFVTFTFLLFCNLQGDDPEEEAEGIPRERKHAIIRVSPIDGKPANPSPFIMSSYFIPCSINNTLLRSSPYQSSISAPDSNKRPKIDWHLIELFNHTEFTVLDDPQEFRYLFLPLLLDRIFGTFGAKNDALGMVITRGCGCDGTGTRAIPVLRPDRRLYHVNLCAIRVFHLRPNETIFE
ncbi:hypothetical protein KIW84_071795 [Lathyrus oleraceus]|uniref:F-ATPase protein 6 n=1 Tax=Pisum sativum TaxID=3888 RepID=A0A9D4VJZ7_PEA|nr:hypothetical protein KIW84_MT0038 [Pisum sativum]KAI5384941.1 hypothetical protein KIW84_071795 [Pisum sativum]